MQNLHLQEITYQIIGLCMEVHKVLGHGFLEAVYKDAIEIEALRSAVLVTRERQYNIDYKGSILPHTFFADFVVEDKVIVEVKAAEGAINDTVIAQTINYLKVSGCKVGLIVNFGRGSLQYKRLIY